MLQKCWTLVLQENLEDFQVLAVNSDNEVNFIKDRNERGIRTVFTHEDHELKKTLMVTIVNFNPISTEIHIDSAIPVSFMKRDLLHEPKTRDLFLRLKALNELFKTAYQGLGSTISIIGKIVVRIQSKGWDAENQQSDITEGAERDLPGNDILSKLKMKVSQQQAPPVQLHPRTPPKQFLVERELNHIKFESHFPSKSITDTPQQQKEKTDKTVQTP